MNKKIKDKIKRFLSDDVPQISSDFFINFVTLTDKPFEILGKFAKEGVLTLQEKADLKEILTALQDNMGDISENALEYAGDLAELIGELLSNS